MISHRDLILSNEIWRGFGSVMIMTGWQSDTLFIFETGWFETRTWRTKNGVGKKAPPFEYGNGNCNAWL